MKRIMRRIGILLATLVVAVVAASPSLAGMNDGGGFYAQTTPGSTATCGSGSASAATVDNSGSGGAAVTTCTTP